MPRSLAHCPDFPVQGFPENPGDDYKKSKKTGSLVLN